MKAPSARIDGTQSPTKIPSLFDPEKKRATESPKESRAAARKSPRAVGSVVEGETTPLHVGRRSSVWQTRITNAEGKLMALVTQTQMTIFPD